MKHSDRLYISHSNTLAPIQFDDTHIGSKLKQSSERQIGLESKNTRRRIHRRARSIIIVITYYMVLSVYCNNKCFNFIASTYTGIGYMCAHRVYRTLQTSASCHGGGDGGIVRNTLM